MREMAELFTCDRSVYERLHGFAFERGLDLAAAMGTHLDSSTATKIPIR